MRMPDHPDGCVCVRCEDLRKAYEDGCKAAQKAFGEAFRKALGSKGSRRTKHQQRG